MNDKRDLAREPTSDLAVKTKMSSKSRRYNLERVLGLMKLRE
jgi:hypothetical protein